MPSIYQLTPPLVAMNAMRIDSPLSNHRAQYERDAKFFADFPERKSVIREAAPEEFDMEIPMGEWLQVPRLWCVVTRISIGVHSVVPIYRGKKFWAFIRNDDAVGMILADMARRNGIDAAEFQVFEKHVTAKNGDMIQTNSRGLVH